MARNRFIIRLIPAMKNDTIDKKLTKVTSQETPLSVLAPFEIRLARYEMPLKYLNEAPANEVIVPELTKYPII